MATKILEALDPQTVARTGAVATTRPRIYLALILARSSMLDSSALGNQIVLCARASTPTLPLGILKISRLGPVSISSFVTWLVRVLLLSHMPSRLSIKHTCSQAKCTHERDTVCCPWAIPTLPKLGQASTACYLPFALRSEECRSPARGRGRWEVGGWRYPAPLPLRPLDELDETVPCEGNIDKLIAARA